MLEQQLLASLTCLTRYRGNGYDKDKVLEEAVAHAADASIWDMSHPFAAAMCKPWIPYLLLCILIAIFVNLGTSIHEIFRHDDIEGFHFRIRLADIPESMPYDIASMIHSFGILRGGECFDGSYSNSMDSEMTVKNSSMMRSYKERKRMQKWWFIASNETTAEYPLKIFLERSNDDAGTAWDVVGGLGAIWTWSADMMWTPDPPHINLKKTQIHFMETSLPWILEASQLAFDIWGALGFSTLFALCFTKYQMRGRWLTAIVVCGYATIHILLHCACISAEQYPLAITSIFFSAVELLFSYMLIFKEKKLLLTFSISGLLVIMIVGVHYVFLVHNATGFFGAYFGFENQGVWSGASLVSISITAYITRERSILQSKHIIERDQREYDKCWTYLWSTDDARCTIIAMHIWTLRICEDLPQHVCQKSRVNCQQTRIFNFRFRRSRSLELSNVSIDPSSGPLVTDLEQLFAQAAGLDVFLKEKIMEWAITCGGRLPICSAGATEYLYCKDIIYDEILRQRIQWARIKTRKRAIEKLYRSYNCEVSKLLDCCRQVKLKMKS